MSMPAKATEFYRSLPSDLQHAEEDLGILRPSAFLILLPEPGMIKLFDIDSEPVDVESLGAKFEAHRSSIDGDARIAVYIAASVDINSIDVVRVLGELPMQEVDKIGLLGYSRIASDSEETRDEPARPDPLPDRMIEVGFAADAKSHHPLNPLDLIVEKRRAGKFTLNDEEYSEFKDLTIKLGEVFNEREQNMVFRTGSNEILKKVNVHLSDEGSEKYGEVVDILDFIKGSGASPIVITHSSFKSRPDERSVTKGSVQKTSPLKPTDGIPTVSGGVLNGKAVSLPKPPYPPAARAVKASGTVTVQVLIDVDGAVISAKATSGHPLLRPAAQTAARSARFRPAELQGKPARVSGVIVYTFDADNP